MSTDFNATPTPEHGPINSIVWTTLCGFKSSIMLYVFICRAVNNSMLFRVVFNEHICNEWYIDIYVYRGQKSSICETSQSWLRDKWLAVSSDIAIIGLAMVQTLLYWQAGDLFNNGIHDE